MRLRPILRYEIRSVVRAVVLASKKPNKVDKGNRWLCTREIKTAKEENIS